jgi:hypothetical protein
MNTELFFNAVRHNPFPGHLSDGQVDGMNALLAAFERHKSLITDVRWTAYMLATTFHETGFKMQPVEEIGKGRGHAYGGPTGPWHEVYDGEGDVQLTCIAHHPKANNPSTVK